MKWKKAPPDLVETFEQAVSDLPAIKQRKMFGFPCVFINGNMFAGLYEEKLILRLDEREREDALRERGATIFEPMPGRVMKEYVVVPPDVLERPAVLRSWIGRALAFASALPAKEERATHARATRAKAKARAPRKKP
jgi:TfoX/Sxy family transcriptional regulator of competence genes